MKRVLVTGGAGFIGSHAAAAFLEMGKEVLVIDDLRAGDRSNLPPGARFESQPLESEAAQKAVRDFAPEAIFHYAAQIDIRVSTHRPVHDAEQNILNSLRLVETGLQHGLEFFAFASSGGAIYGEPVAGPQDERHPERPLSPYGVAKLCVDNYLASFRHLHGLRSCSMRFSNVYGPRQNSRGEAGVIAIWLQRALEGKPLRINGDGEQTRDFVYAGDLAEAACRILDQRPEGVLNFGTGVEISMNALADIILRQVPASHGVEHGPGIPGEQRRSVLDPSRAGQVLGWKPKTSLEEGIQATAGWFKKALAHP